MSGSQKGLMTPPGLGFVAANARDGIDQPDRFGQHRGHRAKGIVAGARTGCVIERRQVVDVEDGQRTLPALPACPGQLGLGDPAERPLVGEAGQRHRARVDVAIDATPFLGHRLRQRGIRQHQRQASGRSHGLAVEPHAAFGVEAVMMTSMPRALLSATSATLVVPQSTVTISDAPTVAAASSAAIDRPWPSSRRLGT